jgi:hypothetical protein
MDFCYIANSDDPVGMYGPYPCIDERGNGRLALPRLIAVVRIVQVTPQVLMPQLAQPPQYETLIRDRFFRCIRDTPSVAILRSCTIVCLRKRYGRRWWPVNAPSPF